MLEVSSHLPDLLCSGVIHHVEEPVEIVQEMQDVVTHFMRPTLEICRFDAFTRTQILPEILFEFNRDVEHVAHHVQCRF